MKKIKKEKFFELKLSVNLIFNRGDIKRLIKIFKNLF